MGLGDKFPSFRKIPRWNREIIITEKIDGTNGLIRVEHDGLVRAGSRNRWVTASSDNFGFAKWVEANAERLASVLGEGDHYGEWWGQGIQRNYGLKERYFSLFNVSRWAGVGESMIPGLSVVPTLARATSLSSVQVQISIMDLADYGSAAAPGFMNAEGVVIFHVASGSYFKATLENDELPKGQAA